MKLAWLCYDYDDDVQPTILFQDPSGRMNPYRRIVPIVYAVLEKE